ncbi:MAG: DUF177 domain-containing protein [Pseudomonadota bacterium]
MPDPEKRSAQQLPEAPVITQPLMVATLSQGRPHRIDLRIDQSREGAVADFLGIDGVRNARLKGELRPEKKDQWRLIGRLTAEAVQSCVATLAPVDQRIDVPIDRLFVPHHTIETQSDLHLDMDAEDDPDPYTDAIDPGAVMLEALALSLDPYPRSTEIDLEPSKAAPPGIEPLNDDDLKPFAGLASLRDKLAKDGT